MKKQIKKLLCAALSLTMVAGSIVLPTVASAEYTPLVDGDTVLNEWKFDFGATDSTPEEGYTLVTPDTNFVTNTAGETQFGFLGTGEEDYKLTNRYDGWATQKGQVIELAAGGGTGLNDAIGVVGAGGTGENEGKDIYGNQGDKYYPTRFAMKVTDDTYYRIKATVTTLDPEKDANVSLYTERKHPIYTEKTVAAGTTDTVTFSVRVTPLYYEKSDPKGTIADEMVTVGVLGENSALASLEIQQVETIPTFWILGDSTVTDGNTTLPYFPLQNYTGYGTGFMKYLPRDIAMVNAGEGGLASNDTQHFKIVTDRIKSGDYLYFEYGHNETPESFAGNIYKYYDACHNVGAKLIISSPAERINSWNDTTKKYAPGLTAYADASQAYAEAKVEAGATDIAYVNLNAASLEFINKIVADNGNDQDAIRYYYRTSSSGATDTTHFNDIGAENIAYLFFEAAKEVTDTVQSAVLKPILDNMTSETPNLVSNEVIAGGLGGAAWPQYVVPTSEKYPVLINDITFDDEGNVASADVTVRAAEIAFEQYGILVITIYSKDGTEKGKVYATAQVDNSTGYGPQLIEGFTNDVVLGAGDTYSAVVLEAYRDDSNNLAVKEDGAVYSAVYKPTDIAEHLLLNEDGDGNENFEYYGATYDGKTTSINGLNNWVQIGSAGITSYVNETDDFKYVELTSDGAKVQNGVSQAGQGSFYYSKDLAKEIGTTGRYVVSADMQYVSGGGLTYNLVTGHNSKTMGGTESQYLFTVADNGEVKIGDITAGTISAASFTNVQAILDMDLGTLEVTVSGYDPVTIQLDNYKTTDVNVSPSKLTQFMFGGSKVEFDVRVANLTVAKMKDKVLPEYTATVAANDAAKGTVSVSGTASTGVALGYDSTSNQASVRTDKAMTVYLIEAKYSNNVLTEVVPTKLEFTEADTKTASVTSGSKLMVWNSLEGMEPLVNSFVADETVELPDENSVTAALNTHITVKAVANDGQVFAGWSDGTNIVTTDAEYTFRLRDNITLTAQFVKEPGIEDITNYSLLADKASVKAVTGATIKMKLENVVDESGTPLSQVTNADAEWSTETAGVTVDENGVVTIGSGFTLGENDTKTITIKAKLNNIERTYNILAHQYDYYEDFSVGDVSQTSWFLNKGDGTTTITNGALTIYAPS
ncbi:MAG: hypothetical protein ACI4A5_01000, partial [Hominilimicola sp.]